MPSVLIKFFPSVFALLRRAKAKECQLAWCCGSSPNWQPCLYAGGGLAGLEEAISHLRNYVCWKLRKAGKPWNAIEVHLYGACPPNVLETRAPNFRIMHPAGRNALDIKKASPPGASAHLTNALTVKKDICWRARKLQLGRKMESRRSPESAQNSQMIGMRLLKEIEKAAHVSAKSRPCCQQRIHFKRQQKYWDVVGGGPLVCVRPFLAKSSCGRRHQRPKLAKNRGHTLQALMTRRKRSPR